MATDILVLSDLTADYDQFMAQFNSYLQTKPVWKGQLTTMTSQTLLGFISTTGVLNQANITRSYEDAFSETAESDDAIRAITVMQGLRMTRKSPAEIPVSLNSPVDVTLSPLTQFTISGQSYFNRDQISLTANTDTPAYLYEGIIQNYTMSGLGTDYAAFVSQEDEFTVSDTDVQVSINNIIISKATGGLWNYKSSAAYSDLTMSDGRLLIQFGNQYFGTVPGVNDTVNITYAVTQGDSGNNRVLSGNDVIINGFPSISGTATDNPTGGADEKSIVVYKNVAAGSFGTYDSGVTRNQYISLVSSYPGLIDAVTQAQREINPMDLKWMNVIRVSALTNSAWSDNQKLTFTTALEKTTMYSTRFQWQDAVPIDRDVDVGVYVFNTATLSLVQSQAESAIRALFNPRPGLLMTDFFNSDLDSTIKNNTNGQTSYVIVNSPTSPMYVNAPDSATITVTQIPGGGTLGESVYAYSVAVSTSTDDGPPNNWVFPQVITSISNYAIKLQWATVPNATSYRIYGRSAGDGIGLITTVAADNSQQFQSFTDDGSITPSGGLPNTIQMSPIRYNRLRNLTVNVQYADRQIKLD